MVFSKLLKSVTPRLLSATVRALLAWLAIFPVYTSCEAQAGDLAEWREKMQSVVPREYLCRFAPHAIAMDGNPDSGDWALASWATNFADISFASVPRFRTRAKMLWDDKCLYVLADLEEPHVWATLTNRDSVIFRDPDFEVFIDPKGTTHNYLELEMNALNTIWDLRLDKPYLDHGTPHNEWDYVGLKSAVHVRGKINDPAQTNQGWTAELAFPWTAFGTYARHPGPPDEGEQWRMNFSRVEWQIAITNGTIQKIPGLSEDNWVWSPTGVVDMHRPEMWGRVQFTRSPPGDTNSVAPVPGNEARTLVLTIYHAQRDFWEAHGRWAQSLDELGWKPAPQSAGAEAPELTPNSDGYVASAHFQDASGRHVWRIRQDRLLLLDEAVPVESEIFVARAGEVHGDLGRRAAWFLLDNRPLRDRGCLSSEFLLTNLDLALRARELFPWARGVSEPMFLNDVLPYASLDESRDEWRTRFFPLAAELVRDCKTATEAAQVLNRDLFNRLNVHYNLKRKRNNQSPAESIEQSAATCTGLSIILVDACRAVGVPARIVGVPQWAQKEGNHTWVEFWDGDWHFLGADEYNKDGPDKCWFNADAAQTILSTNPLNQIYASSWRQTGAYFPLAWDLESRDIHGLCVSARYASTNAQPGAPAKSIHLRLRERADGPRIVVPVELRSASDLLLATGQTRPETADLNDMPEFKIPDDAVNVAFRFARGGNVREKIIPCAACARSQTLDLTWDTLTPVSSNLLTAEAWFSRPPAERGDSPCDPLQRDEARQIAALAWAKVQEAESQSAQAELAAKQITLGEHTLKWMEKTFGDAPPGKRSLWITLHGGGQATTGENDRNWKGYYGRYEFPAGSINVAPRAPVDAWNMWFVKPVDDLFDRLIADMVTQRGVDPNQVYLIGYSAGGDGVYQLAPRLADRFAAATMCAGHPNQSTPEGLRNLPFFLFMGGDDSAYNRNVVVREYNAKLDALQANDPAGYVHDCTVYPGLAHNMQWREGVTIPRMAALRRQPWPRRVVWKQDTDVLHTHFYWLERSPESVRPGEIYAARVEGQSIQIEQPATGALDLCLSDDLLDLDQPIQVSASGRSIFEGTVPRTTAAIANSLRETEDPSSIATANLHVAW
jgi:poly(3-hydroxybutyrate) depolymerase/transglutaminase-like putative cysteine protease